MVRPPRHRALIGAVALVIVGCARRGQDDAEPITVVPVGTAAVISDTITERLDLVGRLQPIPGGSMALTAPSEAVVQRVLVGPGQAVSSGQQLILLDAPDLRAQAVSLSAQAEAATRDADRQEELLKAGIAARKQVEERRAQAAGARAAATAAESLLARGIVRSPRAGVVQRITVSAGERVGAGQMLVEVIEPHPLDLAAQVPIASLARIRVGQRAAVEIDGTSSTWDGRVVAIAPAVDTASSSGEVLIRVTASDPMLRPGMGARAELALALQHEALIVPNSALTMVGNQLSVFVVGTDSTAHARAVTVQSRVGNRVAVRGDLKAGDRVVTTGSYGLPDGAHVSLQRK